MDPLQAISQGVVLLLIPPAIQLEHLSVSPSVQLLSRVRLFATPWTAARQASLSITNPRSLLKFMSIESVMPAEWGSFPETSPGCV